MGVSVGQTVGLQSGGPLASGTNLSFSFAAAPTPGSTVVVGMQIYDGSALFGITVTDNQGNTYHADVVSAAYATNRKLFVFSAKNVASSGTFTISVRSSGNNWYVRCGALEIKNANLAAPLDQTAAGTGTSMPFSPGATGTLASSDEIAVSVFGTDGTGPSTITEPNGWTNLWNDAADASSLVSAMDYLVVPNKNALNPSWSCTVGTDVAAAVATYQGLGSHPFTRVGIPLGIGI